jgi:hypothetical protein
MVHDVFISYAEKDRGTADAICNRLESGGVKCWMAPRDIIPGSTFEGAIMNAIGSSRIMVLVLSGHANRSEHVPREVKAACDKGLKVIPFWVKGKALTRVLEYYLDSVQRLDARAAPTEKHLELLTELVRDSLPDWKAAVGKRQSLTAVPVEGRGRREVAGFTAHELAELYDFPTELDGRGQSIGLIELDGGYRDSDLEVYFGELKLPKPKLTTIPSGGATNNPNRTGTPVTFGIEICGAIAPQAEIVVYFAPNSPRGFHDALRMAIHDEVHRPAVLSVPWGGPESTWSRGALKAIDGALQLAAEKAITVCCAAGNGGVSDGLRDGLRHVDFPASSPYALACGGTCLTAFGKTISAEVVWNDPEGGATGGGLSRVFPLPAWQTNVTASVGSVGRIGRALPDVAAHASPSFG